MTPEQRLDRLERIMKLVVRAGLRERKETREKINALIDAHMHTEDAMARFQTRTEEAQLRTDEAIARMAQEQSSLAQSQASLTQAQASLVQAQAKLTQSQANTDERLNSFISAVERIIKERQNGNP